MRLSFISTAHPSWPARATQVDVAMVSAAGMPQNREKIVATAVRLLDAEGDTRFSMRLLARTERHPDVGVLVRREQGRPAGTGP
jgi:hypothetical protein